jgi:hypothetical protein
MNKINLEFSKAIYSFNFKSLQAIDITENGLSKRHVTATRQPKL